jgi:hypothetical protein
MRRGFMPLGEIAADWRQREEHDAPGASHYAGIRFCSRLGSEWECWAAGYSRAPGPTPPIFDRKQPTNWRRDMADAGDEVSGHQAGAPDPRARLMQEVAEEMDAIETDFGDAYQIGRVITIVEVITPGENVGLRVRAGQYPWVALGMLRAAEKIVEGQMAGPGS